MFTRPLRDRDDAMLVIANTPGSALNKAAFAASVMSQTTVENGTVIVDGTGNVWLQPIGVAGRMLNEKELMFLAMALLERA